MVLSFILPPAVILPLLWINLIEPGNKKIFSGSVIRQSEFLPPDVEVYVFQYQNDQSDNNGGIDLYIVPG